MVGHRDMSPLVFLYLYAINLPITYFFSSNLFEHDLKEFQEINSKAVLTPILMPIRKSIGSRCLSCNVHTSKGDTGDLRNFSEGDFLAVL